MRARNLKPSLFSNELLGGSDPINTVVFAGLWCMADREGRLEDRPARIHVSLNPYRDQKKTVEALNWLASNGFIRRYKVSGEKYIEILKFSTHQNPHHTEKHSKIPGRNGGLTVNSRKSNGEYLADSLIPDSGFPPTDSLIPDSSEPDDQKVVPERKNRSSELNAQVMSLSQGRLIKESRR